MSTPACGGDPSDRRPSRVVAAATSLLLLALPAALGACSDDGAGSGDAATDTEDTVAPDAAEDLLGPEDPAEGEPVRIGMVSDGATAAYDNTDEVRAAEATARYYNERRGGVGGRPIELLTCETGGDPGGAADCANQLITEGVAAVAVAQSAVMGQLWEPLRAEGVPLFILWTAGADFEKDDRSTFIVFNPHTSLALPIAVAEASGADRIGFAAIDVPQATDALEPGAAGAEMVDAAGLDLDVIRIPIGTPDMTSQMQQLVASGAGVAEVIGNDAFCIAAFQGLEAASFEGEITVVTQCITDATREAMGGSLEGIGVTSPYVLGATEDPTYQQYLAVMEGYGEDITDVDNATTLGGYATSGALFNALAEFSGEFNPATVLEALKTMDEAEVPGAGGATFRCGGSASPEQPAVCTNQWLRATLDAEGLPTDYSLEDASDLIG